MFKRTQWLLPTLLIAALLLGACGTAAETEPTAAPTAAAAQPTSAPAEPTSAPTEPFKVAFVYVAPIGDLDWT